MTTLPQAGPLRHEASLPGGEGSSGKVGARMEVVAPYATAVALVLPLLGTEVWTGYRLATSDLLLSIVAPTEQPLSVRSPAGQWAIGLALLWFVLAYSRRSATWWQAILVLVGSAAALLRLGNAWLDAVLLIAPLGAQLTAFRRMPLVLGAAALIGVLGAAGTLWIARPPALPQAAVAAVQAADSAETVFADWRWAGQLQQAMPDRRVLAAGGLASENEQFWLDYVRIVQDYEAWPAELQELNADIVVLDTDQPGIVAQIRTSADWHVLYDNGDAFVAARTGT